jgi:hypothetical protein
MSTIVFKKTDGTEFGEGEQELLKAQQALTEQMIKEAVSGLIKQEDIDTTVDAKLKDAVSADTLQSIKDAMIEQKEQNDKAQIAMQQALERIGSKTKESKESIQAELKSLLADKSFQEKLVAAYPAKGGNGTSGNYGNNMLQFTVKAPILSANVASSRETESGISIEAREVNRINRLVNKKQGKKGIGKYSYFEKFNPSGNAAITAEGVAKPQRTWEIREVDKAYSKIALVEKTSIEVLLNHEDMEAFIKDDMLDNMEIKKDDFIIASIDAQASAFVTSAMSTANPNRMDAITASIAQIKNFKFLPNAIGVNPLDNAEFKMTKGTDGHYLFMCNCSVDGATMSIATLPVFESSEIPYGTFMVGDLSKLYVVERPEYIFMVGYENDDLSKNMVTFVADQFVMCFIKFNDAGAFVYDTYANTIALLA